MKQKSETKERGREGKSEAEGKSDKWILDI